jgi:hypothetical protein
MAAQLVEHSDYVASIAVSDLGRLVPDDAVEDELRSHLAGSHVVMYHATRLLPYERDMVVEYGLRPLTQSSVANVCCGLRPRIPICSTLKGESTSPCRGLCRGTRGTRYA